MHPEIRLFPSNAFYGGQLVDGLGLRETNDRPWHRLPGFGPFHFYNVEAKMTDVDESRSFKNVKQAEFAVAYVMALVGKFPEVARDASIGIICSYNPQIEIVTKLLEEKVDAALAAAIEVKTVDAFQGREKDIVLWCTVRTEGEKGQRSSIGFLRDERRLNVGLTRAVSTLIVIGKVKLLDSNVHWRNLIDSAERRNLLYDTKAPFLMQLENQLQGQRTLPKAKKPKHK